jgi:hypothetical protein
MLVLVQVSVCEQWRERLQQRGGACAAMRGQCVAMQAKLKLNAATATLLDEFACNHALVYALAYALLAVLVLPVLVVLVVLVLPVLVLVLSKLANESLLPSSSEAEAEAEAEVEAEAVISEENYEYLSKKESL